MCFLCRRDDCDKFNKNWVRCFFYGVIAIFGMTFYMIIIVYLFAPIRNINAVAFQNQHYNMINPQEIN